MSIVTNEAETKNELDQEKFAGVIRIDQQEVRSHVEEVVRESVDTFLTKYDSNGNKLWTRQWGTSEADTCSAMVVEPSGHVYVSGRTEGNLDGIINRSPPIPTS